MNEAQIKILTLLKTNSHSPSQIAKLVGISRQALHRHLKVLLKNKLIIKHGSSPHIHYSRAENDHESRIQESFSYFTNSVLPLYLKQKQTNIVYKKFTAQKFITKAQQHDFAYMLDSAAVYSSNIEGNSLNLNSFLNSRMQAKKLRPKEAQEIEDLVGAYSFSQTHILNEKNMLKAHALLSKDFVNKARQGRYREESVGVFSGRGLEYLAIEANKVKPEMHEFFKTIESLLKKELKPVETLFWASWIHLMMVLIHPFSDGNGRISRLCEKWFLIQKLGPNMIFLPSEEYYFRNRSNYYLALRMGVNYWEIDFKLSMPFLKLLPQALL